MPWLLNDGGVCESIRDWCVYVLHPWRGRPQPKLAKRAYYHHHHNHHTIGHTRLMWIHFAPLKRAPTAQVGQTGLLSSPSSSESRRMFPESSSRVAGAPPFLVRSPNCGPDLYEEAHQSRNIHNKHIQYKSLILGPITKRGYGYPERCGDCFRWGGGQQVPSSHTKTLCPPSRQ
jgi:hypothetical protein